MPEIKFSELLTLLIGGKKEKNRARQIIRTQTKGEDQLIKLESSVLPHRINSCSVGSA